MTPTSLVPGHRAPCRHRLSTSSSPGWSRTPHATLIGRITRRRTTPAGKAAPQAPRDRARRMPRECAATSSARDLGASRRRRVQRPRHLDRSAPRCRDYRKRGDRRDSRRSSASSSPTSRSKAAETTDAETIMAAPRRRARHADPRGHPGRAQGATGAPALGPRPPTIERRLPGTLFVRLDRTAAARGLAARRQTAS